MSLSEWVILVVVPPVNLAVLGLVLVWLGRRRGAVAALLALLVLALPAVSSRLLESLEWSLPRGGAGAQAIVILGGDVAEGEGSAAGPLTLERMSAGAAIARRTGLPVLLSGGVVRAGVAPVAEVMAQGLAADFGVRARWVEAHSADTWMNAQDSAALLKAAGIGKVLLVTHAWHMRRASVAFAAAGIGVVPAPVRWDRVNSLRLADVTPRASGWMGSYYAFHEWVGCIWYGVRAWSLQRTGNRTR